MKLSKLPEITLAFWVMKICATTLGETAGDLLSMTLNLGYAVSSVLLLSLFIGALALQLRSKVFHPWLYWLVILATSTAGTTLSDFMDRTLGLGYATGSAILLGVLVGVLAVWRWREGTINIQSVTSLRTESYYWAAILASNTLGTALGDYLADSSGLGFMGGAGAVAGVLLLIIGLHYGTQVSKVALFWAAFVLTRPLGATVGDLLTKPPIKGGLDFGTIGSSAVLALVLVAMIFYTYRHTKTAQSA